MSVYVLMIYPIGCDGYPLAVYSNKESAEAAQKAAQTRSSLDYYEILELEVQE